MYATKNACEPIVSTLSGKRTIKKGEWRKAPCCISFTLSGIANAFLECSFSQEEKAPASIVVSVFGSVISVS